MNTIDQPSQPSHWLALLNALIEHFGCHLTNFVSPSIVEVHSQIAMQRYHLLTSPIHSHWPTPKVPNEQGYYACKLLSEDPQNYDDAPREGIRRIMEKVVTHCRTRVAYKIVGFEKKDSICKRYWYIHDWMDSDGYYSGYECIVGEKRWTSGVDYDERV